jgi:hypothetical protein
LSHFDLGPGRRPAAAFQPVEDRAVDAAHHHGRAHGRALALGHRALGLGIVMLGQNGELGAGRGQAWMRQHGRRIVAQDAVLFQRLARQIEAAALGILIDIAQDIGQLQRPAQMVGDIIGALLPGTEDATESRPTALATRSQ